MKMWNIPLKVDNSNTYTCQVYIIELAMYLKSINIRAHTFTTYSS